MTEEALPVSFSTPLPYTVAAQQIPIKCGLNDEWIIQKTQEHVSENQYWPTDCISSYSYFRDAERKVLWSFQPQQNWKEKTSWSPLFTVPFSSSGLDLSPRLLPSPSLLVLSLTSRIRSSAYPTPCSHSAGVYLSHPLLALSCDYLLMNLWALFEGQEPYFICPSS